MNKVRATSGCTVSEDTNILKHTSIRILLIFFVRMSDCILATNMSVFSKLN